eukprot:TRINITY_DN19147_c0_g1_i1.p2 TRINITY_DN19147_c0_g1~~TRINITY_DN19147_c0_g1_i1.p2  ORF type:complete len:420 (+),score=140.45 TRINITY_DN19147_c0_g1_i1:83-1342(+)
MAGLADWGIRPVEPAPSAKWLILKRPKAHARSTDYADSSTQTESAEGAEREHVYRVRCPPERSTRCVDSSTDTYGDIAERMRREEYRATWDAERAALRRTASISGQHEEALARCHQKAFRTLPKDQKCALVAEEDELEGMRREATAESDKLAERANACGRRPWTPTRGRQYERREARKVAVLAGACPRMEAWRRERERAEEAAAWDRIEEAAQAAREKLAAQAPAMPSGDEQWVAPREGQGGCGQGDLGGGGAPLALDSVVNLVRNPAALQLLRREESERRGLRGDCSALWADWQEKFRGLARQAARLYLMEMLVLVDALTGPSRVAAEEQSARLQTARGESQERAAALGLRLRDEPAERLQLRTAEAAARAELNAEFRAPPVPRPPACECPCKPVPYTPPKDFGWWVADSVRRARGWA